MRSEVLDNLRARRSVLLRQLALVETAIAAETGMCAFRELDDRLAESLDALCLANAPCEITVADLRELPAAQEPQLGLN